MVYENRKLAVATGVEERLRRHFQKRKSKLKKKRDENIDNNPPSKRAKLLIMRNYDSEEEGTSDYGKTADKQDNSEEETDDVSGDSRHPLTDATNITPL
jgi:hypothetical protein